MATAARSEPLRRAGSLLGLLGLELAAVLALHWLGRFPGLRIRWDEPVPWVLSSPVQEVLGALLRTVGLVMAYWLLASTVLYLLARLTRLPAVVRAVGWATLPLARRVADHAVAVTIVTSMVGGSTLGVGGPALAATHQEAPPSSATETTEPPPATPYVPDPAGEPTTSASATTAPETTAPEAAEPPATPYVPTPADAVPAQPEEPTATTPTSATEAPTTSEAPTTTAETTTTTAETTTTTQATPTTSEAPTTTEASAAPAAPPTTAAPTSGSTASTEAPTATAPPAPTTTHAYEFNPATPGTTQPPQEPPTPSSTGGGGQEPRNPPGDQPGDQPGGDDNTPSEEEGQEPYQVARGDNLWAIARAHLAESRSGGSGEPTNREVADYWIRVVEENRDRLRSGDPDLIYPGEDIILPRPDVD